MRGDKSRGGAAGVAIDSYWRQKAKRGFADEPAICLVVRGVALGIRFRVEQHPTAGETVFDLVPVTDARLADLPAQKNNLRADHARKIDQPLLHALANAAVAVDFL